MPFLFIPHLLGQDMGQLDALPVDIPHLLGQDMGQLDALPVDIPQQLGHMGQLDALPVDIPHLLGTGHGATRCPLLTSPTCWDRTWGNYMPFMLTSPLGDVNMKGLVAP